MDLGQLADAMLDEAAKFFGCQPEEIEITEQNPGGITYVDGGRNWSTIYQYKGIKCEVYYDHAFSTTVANGLN